VFDSARPQCGRKLAEYFSHLVLERRPVQTSAAGETSNPLSPLIHNPVTIGVN
jgi:hypothetical protein